MLNKIRAAAEHDAPAAEYSAPRSIPRMVNKCVDCGPIDVTRKGNLLHIVAYATSERNGDWTITRIFSSSLARIQAQ